MNTRSTRSAGTAMLTAGLVLVACGGSDASGSSGSSHASSRIESACDLLTRSEVIGIMGTDVYGGEQDTDRTIPGTFCEWTSTDYVGEEHENPEYAIFIDEASTDDARESFDNRDDAKQRETVRSLGDGANFYIKGTAEVPFLELRVDDRVMTVGVSGNDLHPVSRDEAKRLERAAAELMVKRLRPTA